METSGINNDQLLQDLGDCGLFQVVLVAILNITCIPAFFSFFFMSFGLFNPGWVCLDNVTSFLDYPNTSATLDPIPADQSISFLHDTCEGYSTCQQVKFSPEASTIVTEWGLICDKSWITSLFISLQMAGNLTGQFFVGYLGDKFGRKNPLHAVVFIFMVLNVTALYSVSWQMYAVVMFLGGMSVAFFLLPQVLMSEFVAPKWRIRVISLPTWTIANTVFCVLAMVTKDWRSLTLVMVVLGAVSFVPLFWVPESLRWLLVSGRNKHAVSVTRKISALNRTEEPDLSAMDVFIGPNEKEDKQSHNYSVFDLFRKGYRITTIVIGVIFLVMNMTYFAMSFGVASLPGNLYINLIILAISELPSNAIAVVAANAIGRQRTSLAGFVLQSVCMFGVVAVDRFSGEQSVKEISTVVMVVMTKIFCNLSWYVSVTMAQELYPTVVRSTVTSFSIQMSMLGGIFAPLLIPSNPSTLYICYLVMAFITLVCAVLVFLLPETKGKPLKDTWDTSAAVVVEEKSGHVQESRNGIV